MKKNGEYIKIGTATYHKPDRNALRQMTMDDIDPADVAALDAAYNGPDGLVALNAKLDAMWAAGASEDELKPIRDAIAAKEKIACGAFFNF